MRKAVVAIHGVGSPERGSTSSAVVGLLSVTQSYSAFEETSLRIPLVPPEVVRECSQRPEPDHRLATTQVGEFTGGDEAVYSSSLLSGKCRAEDHQVDVFEVYWGDLSQTRTLIGTIIQTLFLPYRFIFLGELARQSFMPLRLRRFWGAAGSLYKTARALITILVPLILVEQLLLGGITATLRIPDKAVPWIVSAILALAVATLEGTWFYHSGRRMSALAVAAILPGSGVVAGVAGFLAEKHSFFGPYTPRDLLAGEVLVTGWALIAWMMSLTDVWGSGRLPRWTWVAISAVTVGYFAFNCYTLKIQLVLQEGFLAGILIAFTAAALSIVCTLLCFGCALPLYLLIPEQRHELKGTLWTMWFGLSVTSAAIVVPVAALPALLDLVPFLHLSADKWNDFGQALALEAAAQILSGLPIGAVAAILLTAGIAIVAVGPSLYFEVQPAATKTGNPARLGWWLSNGLKWVVFAGVTAGICTLVFPAIWSFVVFTFLGQDNSHLLQIAAWFGEGFWKLLALLLGSVALKFSGPLTRVISSIVGIFLDAESYLRDRPREKTTRALIHQRFLTVLDYVERQSYDQIVFIAHSQGTVILLDALRLLQRNSAERMPDSGLDGRFPVTSIITMGSPLRQLYAAAFPALFGWATTPAHDSVAVKTWCNLYRSGDYVGRQLSQPDSAEGIYDLNTPRGENIFRECCIGSGAHTHYWNSPEVAWELHGALQERKALAMHSKAGS